MASPPPTSSGKTRKGLRIFVGTANLGNSQVDGESMESWLPRHGKAHNLLNSRVKSSSICDGVSKGRWNDIDCHGKVEIIAIGTQESVPGASGLFTATGITSKFTGNETKNEHIAKAIGNIGKPLDGLSNRVNDVLSHVAKGEQIGGTSQLKQSIVDQVGGDYCLLNDFQRGEICFYLFVRQDLAAISKVTHVRAENCGFGSVLANKGGIAVILTVGSTRLSFVNCHLNANEGQDHYEARLQNMTQVLEGTGEPTLTAHHAFVFGDLNFRIALPGNSKGGPLPKEEAELVGQNLVARKDWALLNRHDELRKALEEKQILSGFSTPACPFPPTYKVERKKGVAYTYTRIPSYTDRILFKSNEVTRKIEPIVYEPVPQFCTSDHKPIRGLFFLPNRPHLLLPDDRAVLAVTLSRICCKSLVPASSLLHYDIHSYVKASCLPSELELSPHEARRTSTIRNTDRPSWPKAVELKMRVRVHDKDNIEGALIVIESRKENLVEADSSVGTGILDLEHIIRKSFGTPRWSSAIEEPLLRGGIQCGKIFCKMTAEWEGSARTTSPNCDISRKNSPGSGETTEQVYASFFSSQLDLPSSLVIPILATNRMCDTRVWLIENSSSMLVKDVFLYDSDGHKIRQSRWVEVLECVEFHVQMSNHLGICTKFQLLNNPGRQIPQEFEVGKSSRSSDNDFAEAQTLMRSIKPRGGTDLVRYLNHFRSIVEHDAQRLNAAGKFVNLVVCTQGLAASDDGGASRSQALRDSEVRQSLYQLSKLPVRITLRLCTDDDETLRMYNQLDGRLDYVDVLDDYEGESREVYLSNPWLTYSIGLHRLREAGLGWDQLDRLDEAPLPFSDIHRLCCKLFVSKDGPRLRNPHEDWDCFIKDLKRILQSEKLQYNSVKKKRTPWIDLRKLESIYRHSQRKKHGKPEQHNAESKTKRTACSKAAKTFPQAPPSPQTLQDLLAHWSHQPTNKTLRPLAELLITTPDTFPPTNKFIEPLQYFSKWKVISSEAFNCESEDELKGLLKHGKVAYF
ncbi:hypothetical protein THAOC_04022 [Thalassiosira oceanica]|uniref:C2 domain-containing protein n=1 Tax=Thalassiosira oceanica TaxID=159749 RepID=K0TB19_THAOC|nr:hypothetical protein THAOC_04022 [Thalassiosira oceanica]|eukprot:EJK74309.1 hypothetical protein THAOC_04022 [Thalassiosira oceanica]